MNNIQVIKTFSLKRLSGINHLIKDLLFIGIILLQEIKLCNQLKLKKETNFI